MLRWRLAERSGERRAGSAPQFNAEVCALLHGENPRVFGEMPKMKVTNQYERIAPREERANKRALLGRLGVEPPVD